MKTLKQIQKELENASVILGFDANKATQGSDEWKLMRLGVLTASECKEILAGKKTETWKSYVNSKVAEIATGMIEEVTSKQMAWGKEYELCAVTALEFEQNQNGNKVSFVYGKSLREGCSPDVLLSDKGGEVKCPWDSTHHIAFLTDGKIKPEYIKQCQFSMRQLECDSWLFGSFDKRVGAMPFKSFLVKRDEEMQKEIEEAVNETILAIDTKLAMLGIKFGDQWQQTKKAA